MESKQVLSIEQMQHLQELGLNLKPSLVHYYKVISEDNGKWYLSVTTGDISEDSPTYQYIPAYTLQDVLELLPHIDGCQLSLEIDCDPKMIWYEDVRDLDESNYPYDKTICFTGDTMLEAAYNALVWAIKAGCLKTDKRKQL